MGVALPLRLFYLNHPEGNSNSSPGGLLHSYWLNQVCPLMMRIAYFFNYQLPGPIESWLYPRSAAGQQALTQAQRWQDELTRHQTIYEELLASPEWAKQATLPKPVSRQRAPSARDLTRDLAGWSPLPSGQRPAAKS